MSFVIASSPGEQTVNARIICNYGRKVCTRCESDRRWLGVRYAPDFVCAHIAASGAHHISLGMRTPDNRGMVLMLATRVTVQQEATIGDYEFRGFARGLRAGCVAILVRIHSDDRHKARSSGSIGATHI